MNKKFEIGDRVALSASFLRSIDPSAHRGWPTRYDPGKGEIKDITDCGDFYLVTVLFDGNMEKTYNSNNLIHEGDIYYDAMAAEHKIRGYSLK